MKKIKTDFNQLDYSDEILADCDSAIETYTILSDDSILYKYLHEMITHNLLILKNDRYYQNIPELIAKGICQF